MSNRSTPPSRPEIPTPKFRIGQLIRHRRYGYRGVIVAFDSVCMADEAWYQSNQTRPDRAQPWYHVLVHASHQTTYAAEENLLADPHPQAIDHQLLSEFFMGFFEGRYIRNERPWPL